MKYLFIFLLIFLNSLCFALGEKVITLPLESVTSSGVLKEGALEFGQKEGNLSTQINLLKDRVYSLRITAQGKDIHAKTDVKFLYKYGYVGQYENSVVLNEGEGTLTGNNYLKAPDRFDKTLLTLTFKSDNPFTVSNIVIEAIPELPLYGHFITPFYRGNLTKDMNVITFRYYSNHEELGFENNSVVLNAYIYNDAGVVFTQNEKVTYSKGYISFKKPDIPLGNYTFKAETKHGEDVLAVFEVPLSYVDQISGFYCDQNGRLIKEGKPFLLVGLVGNLENIDLDEARALGVNTLEREGFFQIGKDFIVLHGNPLDLESLKSQKQEAPTLFIFDDITFATLAVGVGDFIGFDFQKDIYDKTEAFFKDYGFYYPLINVIEAKDLSRGTFWETFAQTQTGFIFNVQRPEDFENLKPYLKFISSYKDIILSNEEPKSLVFGSCPYFIRKYNNDEYIFVFETKGRESEGDVFVPNKKDKVYIGDTLLLPDKKDKTKYSFKINPYECLVIKAKTD